MSRHLGWPTACRYSRTIRVFGTAAALDGDGTEYPILFHPQYIRGILLDSRSRDNFVPIPVKWTRGGVCIFSLVSSCFVDLGTRLPIPICSRWGFLIHNNFLSRLCLVGLLLA